MLKSPKSLKEISAEKVSEKMALKEGTSSGVSSFCSPSKCKHAMMACKHYNNSSNKLTSIKNATPPGDNGILQSSTGKRILLTFVFGTIFSITMNKQ